MKVTISQTGQYGLNKDLSQHELPINVWTDALNIRFSGGYAGMNLGYTDMYAGVSPTVNPYHMTPVMISGSAYWIYAGAAKAYLLGDATNTNCTRQTLGADVDYTAITNEWTSCNLGGIPILNPGNVTDPPQMFSPLGTTTKLSALSNWPASTYCAVMRTYKNYLVALGITKSSTTYPYLVKWSHPAVAGAVPSSWDETDATKDAGEYDISDGLDVLVDGLALGDSFIIYKEKSTWKMTYIGGPYVFNFSKIHGLTGSGILARNCVAEVDGRHLVLTDSDVILHDGNAGASVVDNRTRRTLFADIDASNYTKCFVFKNPYYNEAYVCYPSAGNSVPNKALVYNYRDNTVSCREMPNINHGNYGLVDFAADGAWNDDSGAWDADTGSWSNPQSVPTVSIGVMCGASGIYTLDQTTKADGSFIHATLERQGLSLGVPDTNKTITGIMPIIYGTPGDQITVKIGAGATPFEAPTYQSTMTYTIGTTVWCDGFANGKYLSIMFDSTAANTWRLDSYIIKYEELGAW